LNLASYIWYIKFKGYSTIYYDIKFHINAIHQIIYDNELIGITENTTKENLNNEINEKNIPDDWNYQRDKTNKQKNNKEIDYDST